jgi:hypothetical protein
MSLSFPLLISLLRSLQYIKYCCYLTSSPVITRLSLKKEVII